MSTLRSDSSAATDQGGRATVVTPARGERQFDDVVREFLIAAAELGVSTPSESDLRDLCRAAAALSAEVFSDQMSVDVRGDPEIPSELHFTFDVVARGSSDEIVARSNEWYRRLRQTIGGRAELFCLSIDVR